MMKNLMLIFCSAWVLSACTWPEQPHPNEANNTFIVNRYGQELNLFGRGVKGTNSDVPIYRIHFSGFDQGLTQRLAFKIRVPRQVGTYHLYPTFRDPEFDMATQGTGTVYTYVADGDVLGDIWDPLSPDSCTITVTQISESHLEGTFSFIGFNPAGSSVNPDTLYLDDGVFNIPIVRYLY